MNTEKRNKRTTETAPVMPTHQHLVYIKPMEVDGRWGFGIHASDGTPIGWCEERDLAFLTARQNDLDPVSVH